LTTSRRRSRTRDEHGFVLVWFAFTIVLLMAVAAFVVDLMHGYSEAQRAQNAADAGALAGVVYMPEHLTEAQGLAEDVVDNNINGATTVAVQGDRPNQLQVTVSREFDTFFGGFVGAPTLRVTRSATAEYDPPVTMGSPDNTFGNAPGGPGPQPNFWAEVSGPDASKGDGNAALSHYCESAGEITAPQWGLLAGPSVSDNCAGNESADVDVDRDAQYFVIDKAEDGNLHVDLFDPAWVNTVSATGCGSDPMQAVAIFDGASDPARFAVSHPSDKDDPVDDIPDTCAGDGVVRHRHGADARYQQATMPPNGDADRPDEYCLWTDDDDINFPEPGENAPDGVLEAHELCEPDPYFPWGLPGHAVTPDEQLQLEQNYPFLSPPRDSRLDLRYREYLWDHDGLAGSTFYQLFRPDDTPLNPYDNDDAACAAKEYEGHANPWLAREAGRLGSPTYNAADESYETFHEWDRYCSISGDAGKYVLKVWTSEDSIAINNFSIAAYTGGNRYSDADVSVTAADRMGVYTNEPSDTGSFYLARVLPSSVERTLRVTLFDTGDFTCPREDCAANPSVSLRIGPADDAPAGLETTDADGDPLTNFDGCQYTAPPGPDSGTAPWKSGAGRWGDLSGMGSTCSISGVTRADWNGQYVTIEIPIPDSDGYTCVVTEPRSCWLKIYYDGSDGRMAITDVSTWAASFKGNPVRIVK
jgi:Flp pilus assembly protein TadG